MTKSKTGWMLAACCSIAMAAGTALGNPLEDAKKAAKDAMKQPEAKPAAAAPSEADVQKMMEAYMKAGAPGDEHKLLASFVGEWDCKITDYSMGPTNPMESKGKAVYTMTMDGRFLHANFTADMGEMKLHGVEISGYDNLRKKYFTTWHDSMSTQFMMGTGTYDAASKTFTMTGEAMDPMTGKAFTNKDVIKLVDANTTKRTFSKVEGGKEEKVMEIAYTRSSAAAAPAAEKGTVDQAKDAIKKAVDDAKKNMPSMPK
jgi:hypothetical protein